MTRLCFSLRPLRAFVFKRILSWLCFNVGKLEKHQKNMKQLFDTLKAVSRIHIEIDDKSLIINGLKSTQMLEFSDEAPSEDTDASKKKKKKKSQSSSKSKEAAKDGKYVIWNYDEIDTETPLSRRGESLGLKSLVPSSPLSALAFGLIFFLLYGSAILRTDVFSRLMDNDL
jgi:NACalpha-BTF3-like transcription factor